MPIVDENGVAHHVSEHTRRFYNRLAIRLECGEAESMAWNFANRAVLTAENAAVKTGMISDEHFHLTAFGVLVAVASGIVVGLGLPFAGYVILANLL